MTGWHQIDGGKMLDLQGLDDMFSWIGISTIYFALGALCSCGMFAIFRPIEGYTPPWTIRVFAFLVFASFWPILFLLSVSYAIGVVYRYFIGETLELRLPGIFYRRHNFAGVHTRQKK